MEKINLHSLSTKVRPRSRQNIRDMANQIRRDFRLDNKKALDIVKFLELASFYMEFDYEIVEDREMKSNYAETDLSNDVIRIRESVYLRARQGSPRDRFTVAHEIGHYVLHKGKVLLCRSDEKIKPYEHPEWQANTFAGEFLVPYEEAIFMTESEIAETYKVSKEVSEIQKKVAHK